MKYQGNVGEVFGAVLMSLVCAVDLSANAYPTSTWIGAESSEWTTPANWSLGSPYPGQVTSGETLNALFPLNPIRGTTITIANSPMILDGNLITQDNYTFFLLGTTPVYWSGDSVGSSLYALTLQGNSGGTLNISAAINPFSLEITNGLSVNASGLVNASTILCNGGSLTQSNTSSLTTTDFKLLIGDYTSSGTAQIGTMTILSSGNWTIEGSSNSSVDNLVIQGSPTIEMSENAALSISSSISGLNVGDQVTINDTSSNPVIFQSVTLTDISLQVPHISSLLLSPGCVVTNGSNSSIGLESGDFTFNFPGAILLNQGTISSPTGNTNIQQGTLQNSGTIPTNLTMTGGRLEQVSGTLTPTGFNVTGGTLQIDTGAVVAAPVGGNLYMAFGSTSLLSPVSLVIQGSQTSGTEGVPGQLVYSNPTSVPDQIFNPTTITVQGNFSPGNYVIWNGGLRKGHINSDEASNYAYFPRIDSSGDYLPPVNVPHGYGYTWTYVSWLEGETSLHLAATGLYLTVPGKSTLSSYHERQTNNRGSTIAGVRQGLAGRLQGVSGGTNLGSRNQADGSHYIAQNDAFIAQQRVVEQLEERSVNQPDLAWSVFGGPVGNIGHLNSSSSVVGSNFHMAGGYAGFDYAWAGNRAPSIGAFGLGVLLEYSNTQIIEFDNLGAQRIQQGVIDVFGTFIPSFDQNLAFNATLGGGWGWMSSDRYINLGSQHSTAHGSTQGPVAEAVFGMEYTLNHGVFRSMPQRFNLIPLVTVEYAWLRFNSYQEHGAQFFDQKVGHANSSGLWSLLGARANYLFGSPDKVSFRPELILGWQWRPWKNGNPIVCAGVDVIANPGPSVAIPHAWSAPSTLVLEADFRLTWHTQYFTQCFYRLMYNNSYIDNHFRVQFNVAF